MVWDPPELEEQKFWNFLSHVLFVGDAKFFQCGTAGAFFKQQICASIEGQVVRERCGQIVTKVRDANLARGPR